MNRLALILMAVVLAGCANKSPEAEAQARAELEAKDSARCQASGLQPGTVKFDDCMQQLAQQRELADRAALAGRLQMKPPPGMAPGPPGTPY